MQKKIKPIELKFEYLRDKDKDHNFTEAEHLRVKNLPEAWKKFSGDLVDANQVILRSKRQLNQEVDSQIEDFKRSVEENKKNFHGTAPFSVDKLVDNAKAQEKIQEFKLAC